MPNDKPTDGNTSQWDKLKAARERAGGGQPAPAANVDPEGQRAKEEEIAAEQKRLEAGEAVGGEEEDEGEEETAGEETAGDEGGEEETVQVAAHERKKPGAKPKEPDKKPDDTPPPGTEFVEIDGKRVAVAKELAEAYRESESARAATAQNADRTALVDAVVDRVKELLPRTTSAEQVAAQALADAETAVAEKHPMPDAKLQVSDPDEFAKQLKAHIEEKSQRVAQQVIADRDKKDADARKQTQEANRRQEEAWAREQLGIQFYRKFKVLDDANVKPLVDVLLNKKFDEVMASGVFNKRLSPQEGEALKERAFNDVAAAATRQIVSIRGGTGAANATAPEPPKVATSAANRGPKPKTAEPAKKPKEKYPSGSVSSMLAAHKAGKEGRKTA